MADFRAAAKAGVATAASALMVTATPGHAQQANGDWLDTRGNRLAEEACAHANSVNSISDLGESLDNMERHSVPILRNRGNEARVNFQAANDAAAFLSIQQQSWQREFADKQRELANIEASRDSDPAIAIATADIARLQTAKAERNSLAESARLAMHELGVRNASGSGDLGSGTTIDRETLEDNVFRTITALEEHVARTGLATIEDIDAAIARRTSDRTALQSAYGGLRKGNLMREIAALTNQIFDSGHRIEELRTIAERHRQEVWAYYTTEQIVRTCFSRRAHELGASGTPRGAGRSPAVVQPPQVTTVPPPAPTTPRQAAATMPTATWFQTDSAYAAPSDSSGSYGGQQIRIDLTYYDDGSVTGAMKNYGGTVLGSLSGRWSGGGARGRISLSDEVLRVPGSGGSGSWEITFTPPNVGRPSGAWCIVSSGADRRVGRQFGMIYLANFPIVMQRYTTDPFCR